MKLKGAYRIPLDIGGRLFEHDFIVCENSISQGILGNEFIAKHKAIIKGNGNATTIEFPVLQSQLALIGRKYDSEISMNMCKTMNIPARSAVRVKVLVTDSNLKPLRNQDIIACNSAENVSLCESINSTDENGNSFAILRNSTPFNFEITRDEKIGFCERLSDCVLNEVPKYSGDDITSDKIHEINELFTEILGDDVAKIESLSKDYKPHLDTSKPKDDNERWERIKAQFNLSHLGDQDKSDYLSLLYNNRDIFSLNKFDLGCTNLVQHRINLRHQDPIHSRQFRIPMDHEDEINLYCDQLLLANVIQSSRSPYNSSIFVVRKKDLSPRIVLDFRAINWATQPDKYSVKDVRDCIDTIGRNGSKIFSTMDFTSSFWQIPLDIKSQDATAFTVPGRGRFSWRRCPMGLHGATSSFARMMDIAMDGVKGIVSYIDDLISHSRSHKEQIEILDNVFKRIRKYGLKLNPRKCNFGASNVEYLGFPFG